MKNQWLLENHGEVIKERTPKPWVTTEVTLSAISAALDLGYWPENYTLHHPQGHTVTFKTPGELVAVTDCEILQRELSNIPANSEIFRGNRGKR